MFAWRIECSETPAEREKQGERRERRWRRQRKKRSNSAQGRKRRRCEVYENWKEGGREERKER